MCTVSNIGDSWRQKFPLDYPNIQPWIQQSPGTSLPNYSGIEIERLKVEIAKLREDMEALRDLLKAGKAYDEKTGQKDCEMDEKVAFIKKMAELVGVDFTEVFGK